MLRENGVALSAPCGGLGTCGKCVVRLNGSDVLACQTVVAEDCTVEVPETEETVVLTRGISFGDVPTIDPVAPGDLLAVDIGTTTVAAFLLDGKTGEQLATASLLNPQSSYGADVISRIQAAVDGSLEELQRLITDGVDSLVETLCETAGRSPADIGVVSLVGNPAMQQLFLGMEPGNLAAVPFDPVLTETKLAAAKDYLPACGNATLLVV
ncbi:MAG: 2Fe-2S iron-sulfur cluster binding domain-containing protein, partial [Clostridia bacterium]|nr:2Fe-2S iron-sulfur cluster binding domain-containing protein [Clostridia bacterium]